MKKTNTVLPLLCALLCSCAHETTTAYQDDKVKASEKNTANFANVHASHDEMWLEAFGKTYKGVRGIAPFYLEIPGKDSILFVTGRTYDDRQATVYVLNHKTKKEIHFPAFDSRIGEEIGQAEGSGCSEKITSVNGEKVVIGAQLLNQRYSYYSDLQKPEFEKEEYTGPDPLHLGNTHSYVFVNGEKPKN
jgi:hypothetical protein